jgi:hypothetical protein
VTNGYNDVIDFTGGQRAGNGTRDDLSEPKVLEEIALPTFVGSHWSSWSVRIDLENVMAFDYACPSMISRSTCLATT